MVCQFWTCCKWYSCNKDENHWVRINETVQAALAVHSTYIYWCTYGANKQNVRVLHAKTRSHNLQSTNIRVLFLWNVGDTFVFLLSKGMFLYSSGLRLLLYSSGLQLLMFSFIRIICTLVGKLCIKGTRGSRSASSTCHTFTGHSACVLLQLHKKLPYRLHHFKFQWRKHSC